LKPRTARANKSSAINSKRRTLALELWWLISDIEAKATCQSFATKETVAMLVEEKK
jgi:hypothetical protein